MSTKCNHYIAADFGAGSGRVMVGTISNGRLELDELHRFKNEMVLLENQHCWNFPMLWKELKNGIGKAVSKYKNIEAIGVDTWGVDFGLIDKEGNLCSNPVSYRDSRTNGMANEVFKKISRDEMYRICGIQEMEINTVFQLYSLLQKKEPELREACHLLFMPDLFNYFLTGQLKNEYTIASTSSLLNAQNKTWSTEVIRALGLPEHIFCEVVKPGTVIGKILPKVCDELECAPIDVIAVGSHDTASAASVTFREEKGTAFLSSGTWSLLGLFVDRPVLTSEAMLQNVTNEGGLDGKILLLKNITGLWLLEKLKQEFKMESSSIGYEEILKEAEQLKEYDAIIDTEDPVYINTAKMTEAIVSHCTATNQPAPQTRGEFVKCILLSLAHQYKKAIAALEKCSGERITQIHVVGGGSKNELLNQLTAGVTGLPVVAGPVEATAIGNIMIQAMAKGHIKDMKEGMEIVNGSFEIVRYEPFIKVNPEIVL